MNALPQLVHHLEVLFPERIQNLQHDLFFKLPHAGADARSLLVIG